MEFLTLDELRRAAPLIRAELEALLANRAVVGRPSANQWCFFRDLVLFALGEPAPLGLQQLTRARATQYRFEVQNRLQRFYLRPGPRPRMTFALLHERSAPLRDLDPAYPRVCGYAAVVRRLHEPNAAHETEPAYLERVVAEAIDAEFAAYRALPELSTQHLTRWFDPDGPAWLDVVNILHRHVARGWIISNPFNPSTKRLLSATVEEIAATTAWVRTSEYWYLRWWDIAAAEYAYVYRETNRQRYLLTRSDRGWRVLENIRPPPLSSAPRRR